MKRPGEGRRALLACLVCLSCLGATSATGDPATSPAIGHVGSAACAACHPAQSAAWQRSDHYRSMQSATAGAVAGDFSGTRVRFHGIDTRFLRDAAGYRIETTGADGRRRTFPVRYTFGHRPLQQYLIDRGDGVLQAFDVAWDARPAAMGGQRWFHLQPDEAITPEHPFFWAGHAMSWNSHCAGCHSTHVVKGLDASAERFDTRFAEVNVGCEACHGPGGRHVRLARSESLADSPDAGFGLARPAGLEWRFEPGKAIAEPRGAADNADVDMCGACHSLRTPLARDPVGKPYHETFRLQLIDDVRYFADGQIREEVFVLGSFLQSRMHTRGVTCGNCHDPHTTELVSPGNQVCAQCHRTAVYDVATHHGHPAGAPGSACVDCHMPSRTYMVIDERRDHSFPIPRPGLSAELGTPNACVDCHRDRDHRWASERLRSWGVEEERPHWGRALMRLRRADPGALAAAAPLLADSDTAALVKASLLAHTANVPSAALADLLRPSLHDPDPLVRRGAVAGTMGLPADARWTLLAERLAERHPAVRFELAVALSDVHSELSSAARAAARALYDEHRRALAATADLAASQNALARFELLLGRPRAAESAFDAALRLDPAHLPALVDLADLRRAQGREGEAGLLLRRALAADPESGAANAAFGLHLVRLQRHREAMGPLANAARARDAVPRFAYLHAVAQHSLGYRDAALATLREAIERWPWDFDLRAALVIYLDDPGLPEVAGHLRTLGRIAPDSPHFQALRTRYGRGPNR